MNSLYNLARVTTATTGTGTITLGAVVASFLTFAQAGVPDGAVVTYAIEDANGGREVGQGTYTLTGLTLTRTTVYRSTGAANTGKITLSGSAQVFISVAAEDLAALPLANITGLGTGVATALAVNVGSAGAHVTFNGALGTPSSGVATNLTGLPISTGLTGAGTGVLAALAINVGSAGAPVTFNGALGTPSSGTLTSATGLPVSTGVSGLGTGVATFLATPSSANALAMVTDETGTGALVFASTPTLVTPVIGAATGTSLTLSSAAAAALSIGQAGLLVGGVQGALTLSASNGAAQVRFVAATNGPDQRFGKSRGTFAAAAAVAAADVLFQIDGWGDDGSTNGDITIRGVLLQATVEGTVSTGVVPTNLRISTMNTGGTFAERIRVHASGGMSIGNTTDPGTTNLSVTGTIAAAAGSNLGDQIRPNYVTCTTQLDKASNTTLATAIGLTLTLVAGKTYVIKGWLSTVSGATGGLKVALVAAASLSATSCRFQATAYNGTTVVASTVVTALGSNLVNNAAIVTDVHIEGSIVVNVGGTINVQMAQNTSNATTSSIFTGSTFSAVRIN